MHELSLCQRILEIIKENPSLNPGKTVNTIVLEVGQLAAIDQEALRFGFDVVSKGTQASKANLQIIEIQGRAFCETCQKEVNISRYYDCCQTCGNFSLTVTQGEELRVKSMEIL